MTFNHEQVYHVSKLIELMFKGELHCLQRCFRKQTGREDVSTVLKFLCVAHSDNDVFTSKYYIIQWVSTNENSI